MLIDWFTVAAQMVNFLVLVWLLKRFLYKPILAAMDTRERQIDGNLREAEQKRVEAAALSAQYGKQIADLERDRADRLKQAADEAAAERRKMIEAARQEIEALRARWEASLSEEQADFRRELARRIQEEVFAIARRVLADLAGTSLEESMAEAWIRQICSLSGDEKDRFTRALAASSGKVGIRSAFDLSPAVQAKLIGAVQKALDSPTEVSFETAPEVVGGIELATGGRKISWTIASYLTSLQDGVEEMLAREEGADERATVHALVAA